jgi:hypothetical protein
MNTLHTLSLTFDLKLRHHELPQFRGALAHLAGLDQDLFHNHDNAAESPQSHRQRYPLIQYRVHLGQAGVFGINEGACALERLVENHRIDDFRMNGRSRPLELAGVLRDPEFRPFVQANDLPFEYRIFRYLPFSPERHQEYDSQADMHARIDLLATLLRNHIVAFAYGVGWQLPEDRRVSVSIVDFIEARRLRVKDQPVTGFDLVFRTNARLPEGLGLGRKTAFGFGPAVPIGG